MFKDAMWCVTFCKKGKFQSRLRNFVYYIIDQFHKLALIYNMTIDG